MKNGQQTTNIAQKAVSQLKQSVKEMQAEKRANEEREKLIVLLKKKYKSIEDTQSIYNIVKNHEYLNKFFSTNVEVVNQQQGNDENDSNEACMALCQNMMFEEFAQFQPIIRQGDPSNNKLYVILKGVCGIYNQGSNWQTIQKVKEYEMIEEEIKRQQQQQSTQNFISSSESCSDSSEDQEERDDQQQRKEALFLRSKKQNAVILNPHAEKDLLVQRRQTRSTRGQQYLAKQLKIFEQLTMKVTNNTREIKKAVGQGLTGEKLLNFIKKKFEPTYGPMVALVDHRNGFGDKALLADNPKQAVRNATIITHEPTECLIITRNDYLRVQKNFNKELKIKEKALLHILPSLDHLMTKKSKVLNLFYLIEHKNGDYLYKEDQIGEFIYILVKGKCSFIKSYQNEKNCYFQQKLSTILFEVQEYSILGEEIIIQQDKNQEQKYNFTVKIESQNAQLLKISIESFTVNLQQTAQEEINNYYQQRQQMLEQNLRLENKKEIINEKEQIQRQKINPQYGNTLHEKSENQNVEEQFKLLFDKQDPQDMIYDKDVKKIIPLKSRKDPSQNLEKNCQYKKYQQMLEQLTDQKIKETPLDLGYQEIYNRKIKLHLNHTKFKNSSIPDLNSFQQQPHVQQTKKMDISPKFKIRLSSTQRSQKSLKKQQSQENITDITGQTSERDQFKLYDKRMKQWINSKKFKDDENQQRIKTAYSEHYPVGKNLLINYQKRNLEQLKDPSKNIQSQRILPKPPQSSINHQNSQNYFSQDSLRIDKLSIVSENQIDSETKSVKKSLNRSELLRQKQYQVNQRKLKYILNKNVGNNGAEFGLDGQYMCQTERPEYYQGQK